MGVKWSRIPRGSMRKPEIVKMRDFNSLLLSSYRLFSPTDGKYWVGVFFKLRQIIIIIILIRLLPSWSCVLCCTSLCKAGEVDVSSSKTVARLSP